MTLKQPRRKKKLFAGLAIVAGLVLLSFELGRPGAATSRGERWFWIAVGVGVIGLGVAELRSTPPPPSPGG